MEYEVTLTESAKDDLDYLDKNHQRVVVAGILTHLKHDPQVSTRKKKQLRPNPLAPWELRIANFRVFYTIEDRQRVKVIAIGEKEHNSLFIRGKEIEL